MKFTGGLPETPCGWGSTLRATERLRTELPALLARLGTHVLLDAPCGDLNWLSRVELAGVAYIGIDTSPENLAAARARCSFADLRCLDILADDLPAADTILCRDFLQHLPNAMARAVLARFAATGARWLLATSHDVAVNRDIAELGDFRPLNLAVEPFDLGEPVASIPDCEGRILGAWALHPPLTPAEAGAQADDRMGPDLRRDERN